eukprot:gb/GFBE01007158.1/.p1 GENE.gb/GFBE01007158.1/~~gb/GFBE01007158.1/.p1  ORF type:complete len:131 (+),score=38.60 gb/GFBE01007158.1/:1-393(+)
MAPRKLCNKPAAEEPATKRRKTQKADEKENQAIVPVAPAKAEPERAVVTRGSGRGLKAVQNSREQTTMAEGPDGARTETRKSVKEQRLFTANNNSHVETKVMAEQKKKTTRKDGTVIITETKSSTKVCYI